jgi:hypothetical protein
MTVTPINLVNIYVRLPAAAWGTDNDASLVRLQRWLEAAQTIINENYASRFPNLTPSRLEMSDGRRYIRIDTIVDGGRGQRSVFAFIDKWSGDILRAATYKAPAKHARGNLFDANGGVSELTPYGPKYLR